MQQKLENGDNLNKTRPSSLHAMSPAIKAHAELMRSMEEWNLLKNALCTCEEVGNKATVQASGKKQEVASHLNLQGSYGSTLPSTNNARDYYVLCKELPCKENNIPHSLHLRAHAQPRTKWPEMTERWPKTTCCAVKLQERGQMLTSTLIQKCRCVPGSA